MKLWKLDMKKDLGVFPCQLAICTPLIVGEQVFVVTGNGWDLYSRPKKFPAPKAPSFLAVNKNDGTVQWQSSLPGKDVMEGQWASPSYACVKGQPQIMHAHVCFPPLRGAGRPQEPTARSI